MRVAHGNAGNAVFLPQNRERYVDRCFSGKGAGKCRRGQHRAPHVNGDGGYRPVGAIELQPAHTAVGFHADRVSRNIACVMQVFSDVAQAVSCNLSAASVPVEDPHPAIRNRAFLQEHQPESTDPVMPVAQGDAQGFRAGDAAVKILRKDIIVSGGFHFGKAEPCAFGPHMVQIHQLRVVAPVARRNDVCHRVCGVKRGEAGDSCLHGTAVQLDIKVNRGVICRTGINDVADFSAVQQPENAVAFGNGGNDGHIDAERSNCHSGVRRGKQAHSEHFQLFRKGKYLRAVVFLYAEEHTGLFSGSRCRRG